jgi:hypothetical protein
MLTVLESGEAYLAAFAGITGCTPDWTVMVLPARLMLAVPPAGAKPPDEAAEDGPPNGLPMMIAAAPTANATSAATNGHIRRGRRRPRARPESDISQPPPLPSAAWALAHLDWLLAHCGVMDTSYQLTRCDRSRITSKANGPPSAPSASLAPHPGIINDKSNVLI